MAQSLQKRYSDAEIKELLQNASLRELGEMASAKKLALHPDKLTTFIVDRNINYTNICWVDCKFCAFKRRLGEEGQYVLSFEEIDTKIEELLAIGGTQILFQGGVHPKLKIDYYEELVSHIAQKYPQITIHGFSAIEINYIAKVSRLSIPEVLARLKAAGYEELVSHIAQKYPQITIHGFSAIEINYIAKVSRLSIPEVLARLKAAGLSSIPGAGAEILSDRVRDIIAPKKLDSSEWIEVHRQAHKLGIKSTATMMFGSVDNDDDIIEHWRRVRELQDETGGFRAFILWSFQPDNTPLQQELPELKKATSNRYLRLLACSRLYLDNVANIQSSWVTQGSHIGQLALLFGANDLGSTMMEENVVAAAGARNAMNPLIATCACLLALDST